MSTTTLLIRLAIVIAILFLIDLYAFQAVKTVFKSASWVRFIYWGISLGFAVLIFYSVFNFDRSEGPGTLVRILMGGVLLFLIPKLILMVIMFGEDVVRLAVGTYQKVSGNGNDEFLPDRRKFISNAAILLAAIPFAGIIHGIIKGKYNYRVIKKIIYFDDLPSAFEGFTLTHISDIHSGSFTNAEKVKYGVDMINDQKSDVILFTGDLVNNRADEMLPWVEMFSELKAPMGKFSILGNHDYGDYVNWNSSLEKKENMELLYDVHRQTGFKLLRNEHAILEKDGEKIELIGVENWGNGFVKHGDLEKAAIGLGDNGFKILMSHDPSHFDAVVKKFRKFVNLTLSGHTHGMQFGIEIPGLIKWSPVKYRYPKWAGLYESMGRYLYVNRGFGYLAFPGRVGIWPEITVLELRKKSSV